MAENALFRRFPGLRGLPHHPFLPGPTPVGPLALAGLPAGRVFVKHDERSTPAYGGNKPRKLEFVIGAALARGARRLLTTGGLGTHHGLATTILGRAVGLATTLVLVDQPLSASVQRSLRLFAAFGAELRYGGGVPGAALECARVLARGVVRRERVAWVPTGGSGAIGDAGFVAAACELCEQIEAGALPAPATLFVPVGTGGTHAGLVLGLRLCGLPTRVIGVLVTDILPPSPARLRRQAQATWRRLRAFDPSLPAPRLGAGDFPLVRDQLGPGYGAPTEAARRARDRAREAGLALETTYTAKCLAEILTRAERSRLDPGPVLFWNTYNGVDVAAAAPRAPEEVVLPVPLRRFLAAPAPD